MGQRLGDFVFSWNRSHNYFVFSIHKASFMERPIGVEIRYSAARYQSLLSTDKWNNLKDVIEAKSHGTMYVVTDEYLFERGIIEIKIASSNHNYQERFIVGVLRWICEDFFLNRDKNV